LAGVRDAKLALPPGLLFLVLPFMPRSIKVVPRKRGRPATGRDPVTAIRLSPALRNSIDQWAKRQADKPPRSEAIRRLVELGLAGARPPPRPSPKVASKASELAAQQIDQLADPSATDEERQTRKRRLLTGPKEFRDIRGDLPRSKGWRHT